MWGSPCPLNPQEHQGDLKGAGPETAGGARSHPNMWTPQNYNSQQHLNITAPNRPWHREGVTADTRLSPRVGKVELHQCPQSSWMWLETSCCGPGPLKAMRGRAATSFSGPAQSPPLGRSPAPLAPPCSQALQLSVLLIWHLLPSNILYCSLERKYDVKKKTWALMLALAPAL